VTTVSARQSASSYGPSALGGGLRRFVELTLTLARSEFKVRYFGSALGYAWSLVRPLLLFGVIYVFFVKILQIAKGPHYGVRLLAGIVMWTYFTEATVGSVACLVQREGLLRKVRFPRMAVPLSVSLTSVFNLCMNYIVVIVFALATGVTPTVRWLEVPVIGLAFIVLATGSGMLLSALYVRFRDVQPIWDVIVQALFYGSPIMYLPDSYAKLAGGAAKSIIMISPPAALFTQLGHAFVDPHYYHSAITTAGGPWPVVGAAAITVGIFVLGWWVFTREAPRIAEEL
jgi:ABC-2 type transport system permease protein